MNLPLRADLRGETPYGAPQLDVPICLNVNENPYAPSEEMCADIAEAARSAAARLNRYPDRDALALRADLASYLSTETGIAVDPRQIWAANGSNEVMHHLFLAYGGPGATALSATPTYSMYHEYARTTFTAFDTVERFVGLGTWVERLTTAMRLVRPSLVLLASPNNPTGTALDCEEIREIATAAATLGPVIAGEESAAIVVIDEAYGEFRRDGVPSAVSLLEEFPHLVVSRTMSKAFGAAGLRLGYLAANPQIIDALMLVRLPYHLSAVTQATARAALRHSGHLREQIADIRKSRQWLMENFDRLGIGYYESDANFVLFGPVGDRHHLWEQLVERYGVLIREVGPPGYLRVSVGTPEENRVFIHALEELLREGHQ